MNKEQVEDEATMEAGASMPEPDWEIPVCPECDSSQRKREGDWWLCLSCSHRYKF